MLDESLKKLAKVRTMRPERDVNHVLVMARVEDSCFPEGYFGALNSLPLSGFSSNI